MPDRISYQHRWTRRAIISAFLVLLGLVPAVPARGDVVELRTGARIEGTVRQVSAQTVVVVDAEGRAVTIERDRVAAIYLGPGAPPIADLAAARTALRALGNIHATVMRGVTYAEYTVSTTKAAAIVEQSLRQLGDKDVELRNSIAKVMELYAFADRAWRSISVERDSRAVGREALQSDCAEVKRLLAESRNKERYLWGSGSDEAATAGVVVGTRGVDGIWACATNNLAVAQQQLEARHWSNPGTGAAPHSDRGK